MTNTKHDFECLIYICTCKKDEPMTTTKTYTYSFQVDPEIEMHLGSYLKQYEEIGFNKSLEQIKDLKETIKFLHQRIHRLENENIHHVNALLRIERECSRDDTIAWGIASKALENY